MEKTTSLLRRRISSSHVLLAVVLACVTANAAEPQPAPASKEVVAVNKPLDLKAPDITRILSAEELELLVKGTADADADSEVKVEGVRELQAPDAPWPGLLAPLWALAHPTQAWRIFAPLPSNQVKDNRN